MRKLITLMVILIVITSCSTSKNNSGRHYRHKNQTSGVHESKSVEYESKKDKQDGLSFQTAVIITEKTETPGVKAEYTWINQHYFNYKIQSQSVLQYKNKPYDIINIIKSDGKELKLYFDISNFYGKF